MFRRTLLVFLTFVFLCLFLTVGYAVLGLSGPETTIDDAEEAYRSERYAACIRLCDLAEDSLGPTTRTDILRRILNLRHRSYLRLENLVPALADLERLRRLDPEDTDLAIRQIRWTITIGETQKGLRLAEAFLADHPEDTQALELAGEACQASYQERVRELRGDLGSQFDREAGQAAFAALRSWLYREDDDPEAEVGFHTFKEILKRSQPQTYAAGKFNAQVHAIRRLIRRSQRFYRSALETKVADHAETHEPVGAYLGLSYALKQGGRLDDLQMLALIYLHRFDHVYTIEAALDLCEIHYGRHNHPGVVAVADRFLPPGAWRERYDAGRIDSRIRELMLYKARSLRALEDRVAMAGLLAEAEEIQLTDDVELDLEPELYMIQALAADLASNLGTINRALQEYTLRLRKLPQTEEVVAAQRETTAFRIRTGQKANMGRTFLEWHYRYWRGLDQGSVEPIKGLIRFLLDHGEPAAALLHAREGWRTAGHDEEYLALYAEVVDANQALSERGSEALLRECERLDELLPQNAEDVLLMPLAELALERGLPNIAQACAQRASRIFNWAEWPRVLAARAAFAIDDPERAARAAESLLTYHPTSTAGLSILLRAREKLGRPTKDLFYDLLLAGQHDARVATTLLEGARRRRDLDLAGRVAATIERHYAEDPRALILVAEVQNARGEVEAALETMHRASELALRNEDEAFSTAFRQYFLLTALHSKDVNEVLLLFERVLALHRQDTKALLELAQGLRAVGRPDLAYQMILPVLTEDEHAAHRNGVHYLLGGELALELDRSEAARQHLLQAVTFGDGAGASRLLTLLLLQEGRDALAADSYWETDVVDLTSACLRARLGKPDEAVAWARRTLREHRIDLSAMCVLALFADDALQPTELELLAEAEGPALLELLTVLQEPGFRARALQRARELQDRHPDNRYCRLLLARATGAAGDDARALRLVGELLQQEAGSEPFAAAYDEAVRILNRSGQLMIDNPVLIAELTDPNLIDRRLASPRMLALAARRAAAELMNQLGERDKALEEMTRMWIDHPGGSSAGLAQVDMLAAMNRLDLALDLCAAIEPHLPADQRNRFLGTYFSLVAAVEASHADPVLVDRALRKAERVRREESALGVVVHFVIDRDVARHGPIDPREDPERKRRIVAWLDQHLDAFAAGKDDNLHLLQLSLTMLRNLLGHDAAIARAERVLRSDPSLVRVWRQRAEWLMEAGRAELALANLGWLYHYAPGHPAVLDRAAIAARVGRATADDVAAVEQVEPTQRDTPRGRLATGLLALRTNRPEDAIEMLRGAESTGDGASLYFGALAHLEHGQAEPAKALLQELADSHPQSPLSANAGHFARQLSH